MHFIGKEAIKISDTLGATILQPVVCLYLSLGSSFGEILNKSLLFV